MRASFVITTTAVALLLGLGSESSRAAKALGIDVSSYNGTINWSAAHSCGIQFAFAKATEGTYYHDPKFLSNMNGGKAAGLQMGAYDFAHPEDNCPAAEANYFWNFAGGQIIADGKSLFPAVDFEVYSGHSCTATYTAWFNNWASTVRSKTSHFLNPVIVVSCAGACALGSNSTLQIWGLDPSGPPPGTDCSCYPDNWAYWVVSSASVCGVSGVVSMDEFHGNLSNLISFEGVK